MKKTIFVLLFHCLFGLIFQSCCTGPKTGTILGSEGITAEGPGVRPYHNLDALNRVDTIGGEFQMTQKFEMEFSSAFPIKDAMMASALASTCDTELVNEVVSTELLFSEAIEFLGETIPANTDLIDHPTTSSHIAIQEDILNTSWLSIRFTQAFHTDAIIPNGNIDITVRSTTSDNLEVGNTITVFIDK